VCKRRGHPGGRKKLNKKRRFSWLFGFGYDSLLSVNQQEIIRRRNKLLAQLPEAGEILRGSLLDRTIRHRTGCKECDGGGGHPVSVLSIGYPGGHMRQISLRKEQAAHVKQCLENYYALKGALEEICELNQQLLRAKPAAVKKGSKK
jgi:uncharacterized protein DUF6788